MKVFYLLLFVPFSCQLREKEAAILENKKQLAFYEWENAEINKLHQQGFAWSEILPAIDSSAKRLFFNDSIPNWYEEHRLRLIK